MIADKRKRTAALLLSAIITVQGPGFSFLWEETAVHAEERALSAIDFASDLRIFSQFDDADTYYDTLVYRPAEGVLYADGVAVGTQWADLQISSDGLMIAPCHSTLTKGFLREESCLSFAENADAWGYTVSEENGTITIENEFQTARLIVKASGAVDDLGAVAVVSGYRDLHILQYETSADAYAAYQIYAADPNVIYVQPSRYVSVAGSPSDAVAGASVSGIDDGSYYTWGAQYLRTDWFYDTYLTDAVLPEEIVVAVLDTGINADHAMVADRIAEGGVNFSGSGDDSTDDDYGHGTHCAGTICELTPEQVKILPIKIFDANGKASEEQIYAGLMYAIEQGADLLNMSFGGLGVSPLEAEAMALADASGIVCCAAAGNNADEAQYYYPGGIESCITVAAIDSDMQRALFSNYGDLVDVCAPGVDIISAVMGDNNEMEAWDGTSMATPHVTACCALLLLADPELTPDAVSAMLTANAIDLGDEGFDEDFAWGLVTLQDFVFTGGRCALPEFSEKAGNYGKGFMFEISCETEGAEIYYTLDSSVPSKENGTLYTQPIEISATTRVRAVAVMDDHMDSLLAEVVYSVGGLDVAEPYEIENGVITAYRGVSRRLTVPEEINGQLVTAIGEGAFASHPYLQELTLPGGVVSIGDGAFNGCTVLETVTADGVTVLGAEAFAACTALETISFDEKLTEIGTRAFAGCIALNDMDSPLLNAVPDEAFSGCTALQTVYMPKVTVIGASAFEDCIALLSLKCPWESVVSLGDRALANCESFAGSLRFSALESMGESVFEGDASLLRVSLPEQITVLPRYTFAGCKSLCQLLLPGVTEIRDGALAVQQYSFGISIEMPFDRVTAVGTAAFYGCALGTRGETTTFSSLSVIPHRSFEAVIADALSFPSATAVYGDAFSDAAIGVIELPNARSLSENAVCNTDWVILSSLCDTISANAIGAETNIFCVKPSDALVTYAHEQALVLTDQPVLVYAFGTQTMVAQYEAVTLTLLTAGTGLTYQWYAVLEDGAQTSITGADSARYQPVVSEPGTMTYIGVATGEDGVQLTATFTVNVSAVEPENITVDTPVYFTDANAHTLLFVPEADGEYYLTGCGDVMSQATVTDQQGELLGMMTEQTDGSEACMLTLKAGEAYLIHTAPLWQGAYRLTISRTKTQKQPMSDVAYTYEAAFFPKNESSVPSVTATAADGTLLTEGVDYYTVYVRKNSRGMIYLFGLGEYDGCLALVCSVYEAVYADTVNEVSLADKEDTVTYVFTPTSSGTYYFYAGYLAGYAEEYAYYLRTGSLPANRRYYSINPDALVTDLDGNELAYNDNSGGNGMFKGKVELRAGQKYLITCTATAAANFALVLSKQLYTIADAEVSGIGAYVYQAGKSVSPDASLILEGNELSKGEDFVQIDNFNDVPGLGILQMQGIGLYTGTTQWSYQINYNGKNISTTELSVGDSMALSFASVRTQAVMFTVENSQGGAETDCYRIFADEGKNKRVYHSLYAYNERTDSYSLVAVGTGISDYDLKSGTYCAVFYLANSGRSTSHTVTILKPHSLEDAVVTVPTQTYTGGIVTPAFSVVADGIELVQDVDYKVRYFSDPVMFGMQSFLLQSTNTSYGSLSGEFEIVVALPEDAPMLTTGEHTTVVSLEERLAMYRFVPEADGTYMLSNAQAMDVVMRAFDVEGTLLCEGYGDGEQYVTFDAVVGETYYIMVKFNGVLREGTIHFSLTDDYRLLSNCEAVAQQMPWTGEALKPNVRFYDGDTLLTEGVDYELRYCNDNTNVGTGTAHYRGIGAYFGTCEVTFSVVAPSLFALPEMQVFPVLLDDIRKGTEETDCDYRIYSYTAGTDAAIRLDVFDVYCLLTAQLYNEQGQFVDSFTTKRDDSMTFEMAAGETVYVLVSATDIASWNQTFSLMFSLSDPAGYTFVEDAENGVTYRIHEENGYAEAYRFAEDADSAALLPEISGIPISFVPEALFSELPDGFIVYGYEGCPAAYYADDYGFVYISSGDRPEDAPGAEDLNGDGRCSMADVVLHCHIITEAEGLTVSADCAAAADYNSDGLVTYLDTIVLLERLSDNISAVG